MSVSIGKCQAVYPGGAVHPYVLKARDDVRSLQSERVTMETARMESVLSAEAAAAPADRGLTVRRCADAIEQEARMVSTHVQGLRDLSAALERDRQR
jgi:hypothetical protein